MNVAVDFDDEWANAAEWAHMYRSLGLQVVPAHKPGEHPQYKRPIITWKEWEDGLTPDAVFHKWYGKDGQHVARKNMGLVTGNASGGVFCVDLDVNERSQAKEWWAGLIAAHSNNQEPDTPAQRTGGGGRQILFRAPAGYSPPTFKTGIGIDIRGQGGFMMCPPSLHASGKEYEWEAGRGPHEVEIEEAPEWLLEAIDTLRLEHGGTPTGPRERADTTGAKNALGLDTDDRELKMQKAVWGRVVDMYRDCPIKPPQSEQDAALRDLWAWYLSTTASRLKPRDGMDKAELLEAEGRGWSELERKWRYAMNKWDKEVKRDASSPKEVAPEPFVEVVAPPTEPTSTDVVVSETVAEPVPGAQPAFDPWERFLLPPFPMDCLPPHLARWVEYLSLSTGGDQSACAMAALACCSGALDQEFSLKMKRSGGWYVKPRLWVMVVGDPSSKKSPVVSACVKPLRSWESVGVRQYQKDFARWKEDKDKSEPEPERPTRYVLNEITAEKLGEILSRQDRGALVEQDELSGWIGAMEKYGGKGGSADRGTWLGAYNGGPRTVDRLGRGETFIQNLCVAMVGGVQPDRLAEMGNLTSDGLLQRFLPVMMGRATRSREVESEQPEQDYQTLIHELIRCKPCGLTMDEGAHKVCQDFQDYLYEIENLEGMGKGFSGFLGKLSGVHGSLALTLHMIEDPENSAIEPVSERTARNAARILEEFCIPHALELYRSTTDGADWEYLRTLASFVLTSPKERFTASDFTVGVHALRGLGLWEVSQKLSPLVAGGWLIEDDTSKTVRAWKVVPGLRESLAERRQTELKSRSEAMAKFDRMKKGGRAK